MINELIECLFMQIFSFCLCVYVFIVLCSVLWLSGLKGKPAAILFNVIVGYVQSSHSPSTIFFSLLAYGSF